MSDISISTRIPQSSDTERQLLARLCTSCISGTALASATRTTSTITTDISARGFRGLILYLNVTAASGTGGLTPRLIAKDPLSGVTSVSAAVSAAATSTGLRVFHFGPGVGTLSGTGIGWGAASVMLSNTFQLQVLHGDASNYTYSLTYELIA